MKQTIQFLIILSIGVLTYVLLGASCIPKTSITAEGKFLGQFLKTTVDHPLAKDIIENPNSQAVKDFIAKYQEQKLNTSTLAKISKEYSNDVATFYFLQELYKDSLNSFCQDLYQKNVSNLDNSIYKSFEGYHFVFVPGLGYKEDTTTGADFSRQRRLLDQYGVSNELIETEEWGLSDGNALIIAEHLKKINKKHNNILVVSASKGGLETAIALSELLNPNELSNVKSWVNVGGILKGSPIADNYLKAPKCWFAQFMLWTKGNNIEIVKDLSYKKRSLEFEKLNIPKTINVINFLGVPLATQINKEIKSRYCSMIELGPNDGLTPIADEITKNGYVISELGLDHYYRDELIDKKTLALAYVAIKLEEKKREK
jgi:hypothetical protein